MHLKIGCTVCILQITASHSSDTNSRYCLEQILEDLIPVEYSVQIRMLVFNSQVVLLFSAVTLGCLGNLLFIILSFSFKRVHEANECSVTAANFWRCWNFRFLTETSIYSTFVRSNLLGYEYLPTFRSRMLPNLKRFSGTHSSRTT